MKKILVLAGSAAMLVSLSACNCWDKINESCIIPSHDVKTAVTPKAVAFNQVRVLPTKEAYRPTFTPGTKRVHAVGNGSTAQRALRDAVAKICLENDCDMLSAAKAIVVRTTHPRWFFFHFDTYQVKLSGLPLTMTALVKETVPVPPPSCKPSGNKLPPPPPQPPLTKEDIKAIFIELIKLQNPAQQPCPPALIQLKDIRLSMTASADSDSKIGVKLPATCGAK